MTTAEKILKNLEHGVSVIVKNNVNEYMIIYPLQNKDGDYLTSYWRDTIEGTINDYARFDLSKQDINKEAEEDKWKIVKTFRLDTGKSFKKGQKVKILNSVKEISNWKRFKDNYPEMKGEIEAVSNKMDGLYYSVWNKDKTDWFGIGHEHLAPLEEDDDELKEELANEIAVVVGETIEKSDKEIESIKIEIELK